MPVRTFTRSRSAVVLLIYLNASPQSAALRGEGNHLQEHCIFAGERSDHDMDARIFSN
jgi:hypothetical protein